MGASGWHYVTPYDPSPEAALQKLRDDVFARGDYVKPGEIPHMREMGSLMGQFPLWLRMMMWGMNAVSWTSGAIRWLLTGSRGPRTIDEALELAAETGTHSILDITHTAMLRDFGAATPLSRKKLQQHFKTEQPTPEQAAAEVLDIGEDLQRWEAVYFTTYRDGQPCETWFVGCSGD